MLITDIKATFNATEDIPAGRRVKYVAGGGVALADDSETEIGVSGLHSGKSTYASGEAVQVHLRCLPVLCEAAGTFSDGATVKQMADGKVDDTGTGGDFGTALQASTASGEYVQVLPFNGVQSKGAIPADITSSNLTGVDGAGSNAAPLAGTETRLDALEAKLNALLAVLRK